MATGKKAFTGHSQASLIAAILEHEPEPISAIQPMSPPAFGRLVKNCLAKDPDERIQTAHDVALELKGIAEGSQAGVPGPIAARRTRPELFPWIALVLVAAVAAWLALGGGRRPPVSESVVRSAILMPEQVSFRAVAVAPDGTRLVFVGEDATGKSLLWLRRLDSPSGEPIAGSEHADVPFW